MVHVTHVHRHGGSGQVRTNVEAKILACIVPSGSLSVRTKNEQPFRAFYQESHSTWTLPFSRGFYSDGYHSAMLPKDWGPLLKNPLRVP